MCIHASWMDPKFCSLCTPRPKVIPRTYARGTNNTGSDEITVDADLIESLCDQSSDPVTLRRLLHADELPEYGSSNDPGCIFYRPAQGTTWERVIVVTMANGRKSLTSAPRAAFAATAAYAGMPLLPGEHATHLCHTEIHDDIRMCCINPVHIVGT